MAEPKDPNLTLKQIADEVRTWPPWMRTSTSVANTARERERREAQKRQ